MSKLLYAGLVTAVALPMALLGAASFIDTPWAVAMDRAKKVRASLYKFEANKQYRRPHHFQCQLKRDCLDTALTERLYRGSYWKYLC